MNSRFVSSLWPLLGSLLGAALVANYGGLAFLLVAAVTVALHLGARTSGSALRMRVARLDRFSAAWRGAGIRLLDPSRRGTRRSRAPAVGWQAAH